VDNIINVISRFTETPNSYVPLAAEILVVYYGMYVDRNTKMLPWVRIIAVHIAVLP